MLNIPVEIQELIKTDGVKKNFRVHFPNGERADITNDNIVSESVSFTESVCSADTFRFGLAEASEIQFEMVGIENIIGMTIECSMEFAVPANMQATYGAWYSVPYGKFVVESCPRDHKDMAHRRVTGYSLIKYMFDIEGFLQNTVLATPSVVVPAENIVAYILDNTSEFAEKSLIGTGRQMDYLYLFDSSGYAYSFLLYKDDEPLFNGYRMYTDVSGYRLEYEETGPVTNDEAGMQIVEYLDNNGYDLTYDASGNKVFDSNEEALRFVEGYLFRPTIYPYGANANNYRVGYRPYPAVVNRYCPNVQTTMQTSTAPSTNTIYFLGDANTVKLSKSSSSNVWASTTSWTVEETISITDYSANVTLKNYSCGSNSSISLKIKETMTIQNAFAYEGRVSSKEKWFYSTMYAYSNAYSNRDVLNGWAELNCAFVHSERDGSVSMESLDDSNPYQLELSDVEGQAWWDEYAVNPIGTVRYTFCNPRTNKIANAAYTFNEDAKSVYDLSENKILESVNFSIKKAKTGQDMLDETAFYLFTGTQFPYTAGDFYYWNGSSWTSGGHYTGVTSLVEFVLDQLFVPHINAVNFTPAEMSIRGLPYLEAEDAFTLTANDGTVLNSYVLNHTFDGIQHISEDITSVSGEIIE